MTCKPCQGAVCFLPTNAVGTEHPIDHIYPETPGLAGTPHGLTKPWWKGINVRERGKLCRLGCVYVCVIGQDGRGAG